MFRVYRPKPANSYKWAKPHAQAKLAEVNGLLCRNRDPKLVLTTEKYLTNKPFENQCGNSPTRGEWLHKSYYSLSYGTTCLKKKKQKTYEPKFTQVIRLTTLETFPVLIK